MKGSNKNNKILFVEDDRVDRIAIVRYIKKNLFHFDYSLAGSVVEAKKMLIEKKYDAVVIDFFLGDGIAFDLFNLVRGSPIIIITGAGDQEIAVRAMKCGAYDYLIKDHNGNYLKALPVTLENAIQHRRAEEDLKRYRHYLEITNEQLQNEISERKWLYKDLEDKIRELESFVNTASHDLKAPLVVLGGYSSIILKKYYEKLDDEGRQYLELICSQVVRMEKLIRDLLELSRVGKVLGEMEYIDVKEIIHLVEDGFRSMFEQKEIILKVPEKFPMTYCDSGRIRQVFQNLIDNAVKFMGDQTKPEIEIGCSEYNDNFYQFFVKDNGIGIDSEYHEIIFQEFKRLEDHDAEGTGIGLAIVKKIIENHGGKIRVVSKRDLGSTFLFTLPKDAHSNKNETAPTFLVNSL